MVLSLEGKWSWKDEEGFGMEIVDITELTDGEWCHLLSWEGKGREDEGAKIKSAASEVSAQEAASKRLDRGLWRSEKASSILILKVVSHSRSGSVDRASARGSDSGQGCMP